MIDAFHVPERAEHCGIGIGAEREEIARARALPRGGDDEIRGIAAKSLQEIAPITTLDLIELDHRFADREDFGGKLGHGLNRKMRDKRRGVIAKRGRAFYA